MTNNYSGSCHIWNYEFIKPDWFVELHTERSRVARSVAYYAIGTVVIRNPLDFKS